MPDTYIYIQPVFKLKGRLQELLLSQRLAYWLQRQERPCWVLHIKLHLHRKVKLQS